MEATVSSNKYRTLLSDIMIFIIGTVLAKSNSVHFNAFIYHLYE